MPARLQLTTVTLCLILAAPFALQADIYRWDNGKVIPDTGGITPGPGVQLDRMALEYANLGTEDLTGASFEESNLTSANLTGSTLTGANLTGANLTQVSLSGSTLAGANLTGAVVMGAYLFDTTSQGFTQAQLRSTASYQAKDLQLIELGNNDLTGWDFSGQNLSGANLIRATLTNANLTGANLRTADLSLSTGLHSATVDPHTIYNQWTIFPGGFDPVAAGLTLAVSPTGDLDADDVWDADDVDMLTEKIGLRLRRWSPLPNAAFDVNGDGAVDLEDHRTWVKDLRQTYFGDANLDGEFNSNDFEWCSRRASTRKAHWALGGNLTVNSPAGPKATGTATASSTATTLSPPSRTAATSEDRDRVKRCQSRHRECWPCWRWDC